MTIEFSQEERRRKVLLGSGVVMALVAGAAAYFLGSGGNASGDPRPARAIVVAAVDIPARAVIDGADLTTRQVANDDTYANAYADAGAVVGLVTSVPIFRDQPITPNLFATVTAGAAFSILSPTETVTPDSPIWRAASVRVPKDRAVGGQIVPGQRVDLISTVGIKIFTVGTDGKMVEAPSQEGYYTERTTKVAWPDLQVLSVDREEDIYVLRVTLHDAEEIGHLQQAGDSSFGIVLRPEVDTRSVELSGYGETTNRIIEQHVFPLPQIIDTGTYPQPSPEPAATPVPSVAPSEAPAPSPSPDASVEPGSSEAP
jgi:Flp pilus assembly protein CpaB